MSKTVQNQQYKLNAAERRQCHIGASAQKAGMSAAVYKLLIAVISKHRQCVLQAAQFSSVASKRHLAQGMGLNANKAQQE